MNINEFPLKFNQDEYDRSLGLYQKFLTGDKTKKIEKLYSMSAFQVWDHNIGFITDKVYHKYAEYLHLSVKAILNNTTDWYVRIYIDESILHPQNPDSGLWKNKLNLLKHNRVQIICIKFPRYYLPNHCHKELLAVMFRYLTLFDPNVSISVFRDIDNIYTDQHQYFIDTWLERGDDICLYMNEHYKRQQLSTINQNDIVLEDKFYNTLLSGLWNIKKSFDEIFSKTIWQKIFAYTESYTELASKKEYSNYKYYGIRFNYGFDELALTRIVLPILIDIGLTVYIIPVRIYDIKYFKNMFENPISYKFLQNVSDEETLRIIKKIIISDYWVMYTETAGLAQYVLCIITNIYFGIIARKSKFYTDENLILGIKNEIMPNALLMSIGIFTFKNFNKYNWYPIDGKDTCGSLIVNNFLATNKKITLEEWTANI
jgi:hypothetical protein